MTSRNFKQSMVNQDQEITFEVVKVSGSWVFPAASSIVEATRGKNMYLRLSDDGKSEIFRLDSVKDGDNIGETVFGFVGNGGMDIVELTATTDGTGTTNGSWEYEPGKGPAGGGENKCIVFDVDTAHGKNYPTFQEINSAVGTDKCAVLRVVNYNGQSDSPADYYYLCNYMAMPHYHSYTFSDGKKTKSVTSSDVWSEADIVYGITNGGSKTETDLVDGALTIAATNSVTKLTLTTAQSLTVKANDGVPNFALEIDNTGNINDVTVTVMDSTETATLNPSYSGGTKCYAGKFYQLTCVGTCWNITEYFA